ncbi:MAG: hypothetical protein AAGF12_18310, partial [Myxococcota bacterium]
MRTFLTLLLVAMVAACSGRSGRRAASAGDSGNAPTPEAGPSDDAQVRADGEVIPDAEPDRSVNPPPPPPGPGTPRDAAAVLFIGHSLVNRDMPRMTAAIADSMGVRHDIAEQVIN